MSASQTYRIAHTAQCKLKMSADAPDRNLRFILGHAFTLDKMMLRIAEIENSGSDSDSDSEGQEQISTPAEDRRVSFSRHREEELKSASSRNRSPPPPPPVLDDGDSTDSDEDEDVEEDDEEEGLGLRRYASATAAGPKVAVMEVGDEDVGERDFSDEELKSITQSEASEELGKAYNHVRGCPCHGTDCPKGERVWELPHGGKAGVRRAVVQVDE